MLWKITSCEELDIQVDKTRQDKNYRWYFESITESLSNMIWQWFDKQNKWQFDKPQVWQWFCNRLEISPLIFIFSCFLNLNIEYFTRCYFSELVFYYNSNNNNTNNIPDSERNSQLETTVLTFRWQWDTTQSFWISTSCSTTLLITAQLSSTLQFVWQEIQRKIFMISREM